MLRIQPPIKTSAWQIIFFKICYNEIKYFNDLLSDLFSMQSSITLKSGTFNKDPVDLCDFHNFYSMAKSKLNV